MKKFVCIRSLSQDIMVQHLGVRSSILERFDDSCSGNEDVPEATDDEELVFVPFISQII